jgi:hypothetical protein
MKNDVFWDVALTFRRSVSQASSARSGEKCLTVAVRLTTGTSEGGSGGGRVFRGVEGH